jgi:20S proteasome subunit alpha 6
MESVKQGSACVGIKGENFVVLGALKRSPSEMSTHQKKIMKIDDHMAIAIAGLTADARSIAKWMRNECLNHKYVFGSEMQANRLVVDLADRHQRTTQMYVRRPYGVGLLVGAVDATGTHLFQTCPSGNYYEYYATAIGARSQSAKTYLEKHYDSFAAASKDELILHALRSLAGCVQGDGDLNKDNGSVSIIGEGEKMILIEGDELQVYLDMMEVSGGGDGESMETAETA